MVTGGAGFIGSNLVHGLNRKGREDVIVVDDLTNGAKVRNLIGARLVDYVDKDELRDAIRQQASWLDWVEAVFHHGASSSTTEPDGKYVLDNNHTYSKELLAECRRRKIPFIYASSAAVYGNGKVFREYPEHERPLNAYGFSKAVFDAYVRTVLDDAESQIVGLRYFNVYGPREAHKGKMASQALQLDDQLAREPRRARLFGAEGPCEAGEQRRDFIFVDDAVDVVLWFFEHPEKSGIFNCGTGQSRTFNDLAREVIKFNGAGEIEYVPFPPELRGRYQDFTEADTRQLRATGYDRAFTSLEDGVGRYLGWRRESGER